MADNKGYTDTKEFVCTGCGKKIMLTKFASQKTCKCDECKANNIPINPDIVAEALKSNPPKDRKKSSDNSDSATKTRPCIKCGKNVEVSKFMSDQKVLCDDCKGTPSRPSAGNKITIDKSKLSMINLAPIEEYEVNEGVIANKKLREICCPSCGHKYLKPLMIVDWSLFGMIINYQCQECYTTVNISEQSRHPIKIYSPSKRFDYTGTEVKALGMNYTDSSRIANALCILIKKCEDSNINIDEVFKDFSDSLPPYKWNNEKPCPSGFVIPPEDEWMDAIDSAYKLLKNAERISTDVDNPDGSKYIQISDTSANTIADKLIKILKGGSKKDE